MTPKLSAIAVVLALGIGSAPQIVAAQSATTNIGSDKPDSRAINQLQLAAQRLRDAAQKAAQLPAGGDRNYAIRQANSALLEVKQAMISLPPELRSKEGSSTRSMDRKSPSIILTPTDQGPAFDLLQQAAQRLRESVQSMAQEPAGDGRNNAISATNDALFDANQALVALVGSTRGAGLPRRADRN